MSKVQHVLAIIPARGGSKGIPRKNVRLLAGQPLLAYSINHARQTPAINRVVVSTDDTEIAAVSEYYGAEIIWRPAELSGDNATSESALLHTLDHLHTTEGYDPELVVFIQATSPIRRPNDLQNAINEFQAQQADSLLSVNDFHVFLWQIQNGTLRSLTYDYTNRPRRQDKPQEFIENGSFYLFKPWVLRENNNRLGGKIVLYHMDMLSYFGIDELGDFELLEKLMLDPSSGVMP